MMGKITSSKEFSEWDITERKLKMKTMKETLKII